MIHARNRREYTLASMDRTGGHAQEEESCGMPATHAIIRDRFEMTAGRG